MVEFAIRVNSKHAFIQKTSEKIGFPRWDKIVKRPNSLISIASERGESNTTNTVQNVETYYVPFVRDSQNYVNAAMAIRIINTDTTISYLCDWQYHKLIGQYSKAENFAIFFMILNKAVFGHDKFLITDKELFKRNGVPSLMVELKSKPLNSNVKLNLEYVEYCQEVTISWNRCEYIAREGICFVSGSNIERSPTCDHCGRPECPPDGTYNYQYCWGQWDDGDSGGGPGPGSGGEGGGGGGSGSTPPDNPCDGGGNIPTYTKSAPAKGNIKVNVVDPSDPCAPGWEPGVQYELPDSEGFFVSRLEELGNALNSDRNALMPCDLLFEILSKQYYQDLTNFTVPQSVKNRIQNIINTNPGLNNGNFYLQTIDNASGALVNCDYFPVNITALPTINGQVQTAESFLEYFRLHINDFVSPSIGVTFNPYIGQGLNETAMWNQPGAASLGSIVHIAMTQDGSVIESGYSNSGPPPNHSFTFSTMFTPLDGHHPVNGNRRFGIYEASAGNLVFYTAGVDRITTNGFVFGSWLKSIVSTNGFEDADRLWRDVQNNMINFINTHGGAAAKFSIADYTVRPNWDDVKAYLRKQINFQELKRRLGC